MQTRQSTIARLAASAACLAAAPPICAAPPVYTTLAKTGDSAPGAGAGVTYLYSYYPVIGDGGVVGFDAYVDGPGVTPGVNDHGLWIGQPGSLAIIARNGDQVPPLAAGVVYVDVFGLLVNSAGQASFHVYLSGTGVDSGNDEALMRVSAGSTAVLLRTGDSAPGIGGGVSISGFAGGAGAAPVFNGAGQIAVCASLTGTGVTASNNNALWVGAPGSLALAARKGSAARGLGAGVILDSVTSFGKVLNDAGQVAFAALVTGTGVNATNDSAIWRATSSSLSLVAREGSVAPGLGGSILIGDLTSGKYGINASGQIVFNSLLTAGGVTVANNEALWIGTPGSLTMVARKGDPAPGLSGETYGTFDRVSVNASGAVMFRTLLSNGYAIFAGLPGSVALIVNPGMPAPGTPAGVTFSPSNGASLQHLNDSGNVAVYTRVTGAGVTSSNDNGIWVKDGATLRLVAREGDAYEVSPGVFKMVTFIGMSSDAVSPQNGQPRVFSNQNKLVLLLGFDDGSVAEVLADLSGGAPTGACCINQSTCEIHTQQECENALSGVYHGNNSVCRGTTCQPAIPGDTNGDGHVDVNDLLAVITHWGSCPAPPTTCVADVTHDGTVDVNDLLTVITHWG